MFSFMKCTKTSSKWPCQPEAKCRSKAVSEANSLVMTKNAKLRPMQGCEWVEQPPYSYGNKGISFVLCQRLSVLNCMVAWFDIEAYANIYQEGLGYQVKSGAGYC